jgi:hypothetical protein
VRIVDSEAPHCLNASQIVAVAQWLRAIAPKWTKTDLIVINEPGISANFKLIPIAPSVKPGAPEFPRFTSLLGQLAVSIFNGGYIPLTITCHTEVRYELWAENGDNPDPFGLIKFRGIRVPGTNAYISLPTETRIGSVADYF